MQSNHLLRPRRASDILDTTFSLYRAYFRSFLVITAVFLVPTLILQLIFPATALLIQSFQVLLLTPLLSGVVSSASLQAYWQRTPQLRASYQHGRRKYLSVFGSSLLIGIITALPALVFGAVFAMIGFALDVGIAGITALAVVGVAPVIIFFIVKYAVVVPVLMHEDCNADTAMRRSWKLSTGMFKHTALVAVASGLLTVAITDLPDRLLGYFISSALLPQSATWLGFVLTQLGLMLTIPFNQIVATVLYYDLRIRNEGYDLEVASAQQLHMGPASIVEA